MEDTHDTQAGVGPNRHIPPSDPSILHFPLLDPTYGGHSSSSSSSSSSVSSPQPMTAAATRTKTHTKGGLAAALCLLVFSLHNGWNCFVFLNYVNYSPARALLNATDPEIG